MARELDSNINSAIGLDVVEPFFTLDLEFDSPNEVYLWSGLGELSLDGNTYQGAGELLGISELRESSDIAAYGAELTLSGIPTSLITDALQENYQGRKSIVKFGVISGGVTYASTVFSGEMDQMNIQMGPDTCSITLDVESRLVDLNRPRIKRYTDADQKSRYPTDEAFGFVTRLQSESLKWAG
jgi:hypothetical protein